MITILKHKVKKFLGGYNAKKYWERRHSEFGLDIRGVGNKGLSVKENIDQYHNAKEIFIQLLNENGIELKNKEVLDIGCGNGFYAEVYKELQVGNYVGLDITNTLFPELERSFPEFTFQIKDVTNSKITHKYPLISMIDVSQHITDNKKFSFAMSNIREALQEEGSLIITSWLDNTIRDSLYEKSRSMEYYKKEFPGFHFSEPKKFRDKYIFIIKKV